MFLVDERLRARYTKIMKRIYGLLDPEFDDFSLPVSLEVDEMFNLSPYTGSANVPPWYTKPPKPKKPRIRPASRPSTPPEPKLPFFMTHGTKEHKAACFPPCRCHFAAKRYKREQAEKERLKAKSRDFKRVAWMTKERKESK